MDRPELHPWLATPDAVEAARKAVQVPLSLMAAASHAVGTDELFSEALAILTECAAPKPEDTRTGCPVCGGSLENVRKGAKYCSTKCRKVDTMRRQRGKTEMVAAVPQAHIGSMWTWPEDKMDTCAVRTVGYALNNYVRTRKERVELPDSENLPNRHVPVEAPEDSPTDILANFLSEYRGVVIDGTETFNDLYEAAVNLGLLEDIKAVFREAA